MSDYIIYTTDNGVLNFKNDLRIFIGRYDDINNWNKIYTNVKDYYATTIIGSNNIPANEKINIADISNISSNRQYMTNNLTILTNLSFTTSDYNNISEDDTITFTIEFIRPNRQDSYTFTYPLHKMYLQLLGVIKLCSVVFGLLLTEINALLSSKKITPKFELSLGIFNV